MVNNHNNGTKSLSFEFLRSVYFHDETVGRAARRGHAVPSSSNSPSSLLRLLKILYRIYCQDLLFRSGLPLPSTSIGRQLLWHSCTAGVLKCRRLTPFPAELPQTEWSTYCDLSSLLCRNVSVYCSVQQSAIVMTTETFLDTVQVVWAACHSSVPVNGV
jgi:hypothetical protein